MTCRHYYVTLDWIFTSFHAYCAPMIEASRRSRRHAASANTAAMIIYYHESLIHATLARLLNRYFAMPRRRSLRAGQRITSFHFSLAETTIVIAPPTTIQRQRRTSAGV